MGIGRSVGECSPQYHGEVPIHRHVHHTCMLVNDQNIIAVRHMNGGLMTFMSQQVDSKYLSSGI